VKSDKDLALKLFYALSAETRSDGKNFRPFLDAQCLNDGEEWETGFLNGLEHSAVILMLISEDGIKGIEGADKWQDNVLLEYEYALEKHEKGTAIMLPLVVGKYVDGGLYKPFGAFGVTQYPDAKHFSAKSTRNIRETMEQLFKIQGLKTDPASFGDKMKEITGKIEEGLKKFNRLGEPKAAETYEDKYVSSWTIPDVHKWLKDSGLAEYGDKFKENAIDGSMLLSLDEDTIQKELGVSKKLHLLKITKYIDEQKEVEAAATDLGDEEEEEAEEGGDEEGGDGGDGDGDGDGDGGDEGEE